MKSLTIISACLIAFIVTDPAVGTEAYIRNEASNLAGNFYDIYYSINYGLENKLAGQKTVSMGDLNKIKQLRISRAGTMSTFSPWSNIPEEKIALIKKQAKFYEGKNVVLVIGATYTGFGLYTHLWVESPPSGNVWNLFRGAKLYMEKNRIDPIDFFSGQESGKNNIIIAKLVFNYSEEDIPTLTYINTKYKTLASQYEPSESDFTLSRSTLDFFNRAPMKIIDRAYDILKKAYK